MADAVQQFGRTEVWIGTYEPSLSLQKLGESLDMLDISEQSFFHNVPGDRHGGPQGPPIDVQWLGEIVTISVDLSRFDQGILGLLQAHRVHSPVLGRIDLCTIGTLMLNEERSWRVALKSYLIDPADGICKPYGLNFPCCLLRQPIGHNRGTKYSGLSIAVEAHLAPEGHRKEGILWDTNVGDPDPV